MAGIIEFTDMAAFDAWHAEVKALKGYPNPATKTTDYTQPMIGENGLLYVPVDNDAPTGKVLGRTIIDQESLKRDEATNKITEAKGVRLSVGKKIEK